MSVEIRVTLDGDRDPILRIAEGEPLFSREEINTVAELLNDYFTRADHNGYFFLTAEAEGSVAGFACYGPTPLTSGTYDLYWVAVASAYQGMGIGRALIGQVEREICRHGGRLLVVDTSGTAAYGRTRDFYEQLGFQRAATIPDFYREGDPLVLYVKQLGEQPSRTPRAATGR